MNYKCYICGKIIKNEHFFLVGFKDRTRIMCRKCGVKYRKGVKHVKSEGVG